MPQNNSPSADSGGAFVERADQRLLPVENLFNLIAAIAIFGLMVLGVLQIGLRSIFNTPIVGYIDLVELSMAALAFLGASYCQRMGGHIRMEILVGKLRGRALWIFEAVGTLAAMLVIGVLVWYGWDHFMRAYTLGDTTIDAEYPVWPSKLLVPIAFSVWFIRLFIQLVGYMRLVFSPLAAPVGVVLMKDAAQQAQDEIRETFGDIDTDGGKTRGE